MDEVAAEAAEVELEEAAVAAQAVVAEEVPQLEEDEVVAVEVELHEAAAVDVVEPEVALEVVPKEVLRLSLSHTDTLVCSLPEAKKIC